MLNEEEEELEEEERREENAMMVEIEIKSDQYQETNNSTSDNEKKKNRFKMLAKTETVRDLKLKCIDELLLINSGLSSDAEDGDEKTVEKKTPTLEKKKKKKKKTKVEQVILIYQGKVLNDDSLVLDKALMLENKRKLLLENDSSDDDDGRNETNKTKKLNDTSVTVVHMIVKQSEKELEKERKERERKRKEEKEINFAMTSAVQAGAAATNASVTPTSSLSAATAPTNQIYNNQQQQQQQQISVNGVVPIHPMVLNAYNAAYEAAYRSLRPNADVVPRSPGLVLLANNFENSLQASATGRIGMTTMNPHPLTVTNRAGVMGTDMNNSANANNHHHNNNNNNNNNANNNQNNNNQNIINPLNDPNVNIDPNVPYQRIVRRGENGEEIVEVIRVIQFRIDIKLMLKLIMITAFACQDATKKKMAMYITAAVLGYLYQTGILESIWDALFGAYQDVIAEEEAALAARAGAAGAQAQAQAAQQNNVRRPTGVQRQRVRRPPNVAGYTNMPDSYFGEIKIFFYSIIASLFPAWRVPNLRQTLPAADGNHQNQD